MKSLIIGLGSSGQRYARVLRGIYTTGQIDLYRGAHKMGLISRDLSHIEESIDPKNYYQLNELKSLSHLEEFYDLAVIATPPDSHLYYLEKVVKQSQKVIIEKPLSINSLEAMKILELKKAFAAQFVVGYQHYFNPIFNKVIEEARSVPNINEIEIDFLEPLDAMNPFRNMRSHHLSSRSGGGALLALSHEIDFLLTLKPDLIGHLTVAESNEDLNLQVLDTCLVSNADWENSGVNVCLRLSIASGANIRAGKISNSKTEISWDIRKREVSRKSRFENRYWRFPYHPDDLIKTLVMKFMEGRISENEINQNLQRAAYIAELSNL